MNRFLRVWMIVVGLPLLMLGCSSGVAAPKSSVSSEARMAKKARNLTCRVRGEFSEDMRLGFLRWAIEDEVPERVRRSFIISGALAGIGGSGFPVWSDGKKTWIVTNAHVLELVDREVILTFDAGETNLNGRVVYIDTKKDIGFVEVEKAMPVVSFRSNVYEHMPVYAAGYPSGLYQLTPGRVSNRCFRMSMIHRSLPEECWVQHTAAIDPGSSGGPVFSEQGDQVIGMNTLAFFERNDLYLAIPAPVIQDRLAVARKSMKANQKAEGRHESLREACHQFVSELDSSLVRSEPLNRSLSDEMVVDRGLEALKMVKNDKKIPDDLMEFLMSFLPYEIVRTAVLLQLKEETRQLGGLLYDERCETINPADDLTDNTTMARVMVRFEDARVETAWRFDRGAWRIVYFKAKPNEKDAKRPKNGEVIQDVFGKKRCKDESGKSIPCDTDKATPKSADKDEKAEPDEKKGEDESASADKKDDKSEEKPKSETTDGCTCVEDEEKAESRCDCEN